MKRMNAIRAQDRRAIHAAILAVTHVAILAEKTTTTAADTMEDRSREDNLKYEPYKIHFIAPFRNMRRRAHFKRDGFPLFGCRLFLFGFHLLAIFLYELCAIMECVQIAFFRSLRHMIQNCRFYGLLCGNAHQFIDNSY